MAFRTVLLRIMLWSLGLAAAVGALAMLFFRAELIWRIVATAVATGLGSGGLLAFSAWTEREKSRNAGLVGLAVIAVEFPLALLAIWMFDTQLPHEEMWATIGTVAGCAVPGIALLRLREHPLARAAGSLGAALSAAALVLIVAGIWSPDAWRYGGTAVGERLAQSGAILAPLGPIAAASLVGLGSDRRHWRWAGVLAAAAAYAMASARIWGDVAGGHVFDIVVTAGIYAALANLVFFPPLLGKQEAVRLGVLAVAALCAVFTDIVIVSEAGRRFGTLSRLAGATGILTACGCLALAVLAVQNRRAGHRPPAGEIRGCVLVCPACGKKQEVSAGEARCERCGLGIYTRFGPAPAASSV